MGNVRHAIAADMPRLLELGRAMHAESPVLGRFEFDQNKVEQALERAMKDGLVLVHLNNEGGIDGGFAGMICERWFSRRLMFSDLALFVDTSGRGGIAAVRLLRQVIAWCKDRGLSPEDVQLGVSTGVHAEQTGKIYEAVGFERFGGLYRLREF